MQCRLLHTISLALQLSPYPSYDDSLLSASCREELQQPVFTAIDALEYPELHDESIPTLAFTRALNKLLLAAGIKDFTLQASRMLWQPATQ